ncbi:MAG: hypothetical protein P8Y60_10425 [Calditrichota bacterium]
MLKKLFGAKGVFLFAVLLMSSLLAVTCSKQSSEQQGTQQQSQQQMNSQQGQTATPGQSAQQQPAESSQGSAEQTTPAPSQSAQKAPSSESMASNAQSQPAETQSQPAQQQEKLEPINIELPKAMFVGTPTNLNVPNLQKPRTEPRPPFMAPAGTKNVALHKPVTSSDPMPIIGELSMVTDNDKSASDGHYVELGPFLQHVTIDLGGEYNIYAIVVWHFHKQPRVYFDVIAQVSDDPDFIENVHTVFNNDNDNSAGLGVGSDKNYVETNEGKLIDAKGVKGRYIRMYSNGNNSNDLNHYIEVAVYGKPAPAM